MVVLEFRGMSHDLEAGYAGQVRQAQLLGDILMNFGGNEACERLCRADEIRVFPPSTPHTISSRLLSLGL